MNLYERISEMVRISKSEFFFTILLCCVFFLCLIFRSPDILIFPRLWAEEGQDYYSVLQYTDFFSALGLVVKGNLQILTNIVVWLAAQVPSQWAAHVTTYASLFILLITLHLFLRFLAQEEFGFFYKLYFTIVFALLPYGYELYLTATNLQWVCSASILALAVTNMHSNRVLAYIWVALCGLTGVPSVTLAPVFLVRNWVFRSRGHFQLGLVLSVCGFIQVIIILLSEHPERNIPHNFFILTVPAVLQTLISPIAGVSLTDWLIASGFIGWYFPLWYICLLFIVLMGLFFCFSESKKWPLIALSLVWFYVPILNIMGSIGDSNQLISGWGGGGDTSLSAVCLHYCFS